MDFLIFQKILVTVLLSGLIGLERERSLQKNEVFDGFGGVRTFILIGIIGLLASLLNSLYAGVFLLACLGLFAFLIVAYFFTSKSSGKFGLTSEFAALIVFFVGALCQNGEFLVATTIILSLAVILHFKNPLHNIAGKISNEEIVSTLRFLIIAFIVLPLLPDQGYGPYDFFNPHLVWLMVVLISGISFVGYFLMRIFGSRNGILLTGFLGGLVSSTAVTLSFAGESKKHKGLEFAYIVGVLIACSSMFFRILLEVAVVNSELLQDVFVPLFLMGGLIVLISVYVFFQFLSVKQDTQSAAEIGMMDTPFRLVPALKFALLFSTIMLVSEWMVDVFGSSGLYLTAIFSSISDVDAIVLSIANLAKSGAVDQFTAVVAIVISAVVNTLVKAFLFWFLGSRIVGNKLLAILLSVSALGVLVAFFVVV